MGLIPITSSLFFRSNIWTRPSHNVPKVHSRHPSRCPSALWLKVRKFSMAWNQVKLMMMTTMIEPPVEFFLSLSFVLNPLIPFRTKRRTYDLSSCSCSSLPTSSFLRSTFFWCLRNPFICCSLRKMIPFLSYRIILASWISTNDTLNGNTGSLILLFHLSMFENSLLSYSLLFPIFSKDFCSFWSHEKGWIAHTWLQC